MAELDSLNMAGEVSLIYLLSFNSLCDITDKLTILYLRVP